MTDKINDFDENNSSDESLKKECLKDVDAGNDKSLADVEIAAELEEDDIYAHQHLDFSDIRIDEFDKEEDEPDETGDDETEDEYTDDTDNEKPETDPEKLKKKGIKRLKEERKLRGYYRLQEESGKVKLPESRYAGEHIRFSDLRNGISEQTHDVIGISREEAEKSYENISPDNPGIVSDDAAFINDGTSEGFNSYKENKIKSSGSKEKEDNGLTDQEKSGEQITAEETLNSRQAEEEPHESFNTYEFGRIAGNLARGVSINTLNSVFSGIAGDYSKGSRDVALASADTLIAIASTAAASFAKLSYNEKIKAADTLDKIRNLKAYQDFKPDSLSGKSGAAIREDLKNAGISEKDIDNLYKHKDVADDELTIKNLILKKAEESPSEVPEELRKYVLKKGFNNLSARYELKLAEILNKENENAQVRNIAFSTLSTNKLTKLKDTLSKENSLDRTSEMLLNKAIAAKKRGFFEKKDIGLSLRRVYDRISTSRQDLFTGTIKDATGSVRDTKNNVKFVILGAQTAHAFYKKSVNVGKRLICGMPNRIKSAEFMRLSKDFRKTGINGAGLNKLSGAVKAATVVSSTKSLGSTLTASSMVSESDDEEKQKKEKRREFVEKTVQGKRITEKFRGKITDNGFKRNKGIFDREINFIKKPAKETAAKKTAKAAFRANVKEGTKSASFIAKLSESVISFLASIPVPVWIAIGIFILILLLVHILKGFAAAENIGDSVREASERMITEVTKMSDSLSDAMKEINETTILVSNKLTDDEKYVDITDYLKQLKSYDEAREENAIKFAEAPIGSLSPQSLLLLPYQKNGVIGQNPEVLCGKHITHYGSLDKKNSYTLHYMDAYGNEMANHSTNARDVLTLCAVIFSNYSDDKHVFKYLLEDEWYLLNPKIEWQESEIYCCDTSDAHIEGDTAYYIACDGGIERGEKYKPSSDHFWYYCNKKEDTDKVKGYKDAGVKLTGDLRTYDEKGCKKKTESIEFEGDGYDTYDLYLDDYITYDDYLYYVDTYSDEYIITGTFYKDVWYCDGHFINCCFGHKDIDLYITLYDKDYAIVNNIYPDPYNSHSGKYDKYLEFLDLFLSDDGFLNEGRIRWADAIYENDWYDIYGIDVFGGVGFEIGGSLTDADIESILGRLSDGELSIIRQAIIEFALRYVGRIPYYFGGKADYLDYESNNFYSVVEPDSKGRTRKGLDCSGFVSWVFANKGISIPSSTAGFSGYATTRDYTSLKVGDLGFLNKPGAKNNHIGIYAGKDENGNDLWIHCNASACNVSVNNYNGFKYYLSLTD